ncbi:MAG: hypothetical protein ACOY3P_00590 [Planctomycetota bacterium]
MKQVHEHAFSMSGCGCCRSSRRSFLSQCATCAAGGFGLSMLASHVHAAEGSDKPRIRVTFSHTTPETITWPNIGYDYEGHKAQFLKQLAEACPGFELLPVWIRDAETAKQVMADDQQVDGYVVDMVGMGGGGSTLVTMLGKAQRPTVLVDNLYAGGANFLVSNTQAHKAGCKVVGLATSRFADIADVVRCLAILKQPGKSVDDFFAAAEAVRMKNIAKAGDMSCAKDDVKLNDVGECLKRLKETKILVVGTNGMSSDAIVRGIADVFGTETVRIDFPVLDEAYRKADPDEAAELADRWIAQAEKVIEPKREEIIKSGAMHLAMSTLMKQHGASAVAVHCLGGFYGGHLTAYPCLGFAQLNNDGLLGACEADLMSTITMLALGYLAERPGFISDPVIDTAKNQIIYAHCVASSKVFGPGGATNPHHIRTHSEDRQGAAIRSLMPLGYMTTTIKFDPLRRECVFHQGKTVENVDLDQACRTKLAAEVVGDIDKLLNGWSYGWHRVTFYGELKEPVKDLCNALGMKVVEEA